MVAPANFKGPVVSAVPPALSMYVFRVTVVSVLDALRFEANIDLGFHTWRCGQQCRLAGLAVTDAHSPEEGLLALRDLIDNKSIVVQVVSDASYGEDALVKAWVSDENGKSVSINSFMVEKKLAIKAKEEQTP